MIGERFLPPYRPSRSLSSVPGPVQDVVEGYREARGDEGQCEENDREEQTSANDETTPTLAPWTEDEVVLIPEL